MDQSTPSETITGFDANRLIQALEAQLADMRAALDGKQPNGQTLTSLALSISSSGELEMILAKARLHRKPEIGERAVPRSPITEAAAAGGTSRCRKNPSGESLVRSVQMPLIRLQCYEGIDEAKLFTMNESLQRIALEFMRQSSQNGSQRHGRN